MCTCPHRPRCDWKWCEKPARWSEWTPTWGIKGGQPGKFMFMCQTHREMYYDAMTKPIKGLDPPPGAPDDWKADLREVIRHGEIALAFERRSVQASPVYAHNFGDEKLTPAQLANMNAWRAGLRKYFPRTT